MAYATPHVVPILQNPEIGNLPFVPAEPVLHLVHGRVIADSAEKQGPREMRVAGRIAQTSESDVHIAHDADNGTFVLKLLHPQGDERRAERETIVHQSFADRSGIVPLIDHGRVATKRGKLSYLTMPLMSGTLDQLATGESVHVDRIRRTEAIASALCPVLKALEEVHKRGMVHRDIKPSNILMDGDGVGYLTDFGVVGVSGQEGSVQVLQAYFGQNLDPFDALTATRNVIGTPEFLAPERVMGGEGYSLDSSSDMFAVGATVYYLLTGGRMPWQARGRLDNYTRKLVDCPTPPRPEALARDRDSIASDVSKFALRLLSREPRKRQAAQEAADELYALAS